MEGGEGGAFFCWDRKVSEVGKVLFGPNVWVWWRGSINQSVSPIRFLPPSITKRGDLALDFRAVEFGDDGVAVGDDLGR